MNLHVFIIQDTYFKWLFFLLRYSCDDFFTQIENTKVSHFLEQNMFKTWDYAN